MNAILTSTPAASRGGKKFDVRKETPIRISTTEDKKKPNYSELVIEAVKVIGLPRKGASFIAIQKYIKAKDDAPDPSDNRVKFHIRKAILRCVENGNFVRPKRNAESRGIIGSFMLSKEKPVVKKSLNKKPVANSTETKKATGEPSKKSTKEKKTKSKEQTATKKGTNEPSEKPIKEKKTKNPSNVQKKKSTGNKPVKGLKIPVKGKKPLKEKKAIKENKPLKKENKKEQPKEKAKHPAKLAAKKPTKTTKSKPAEPDNEVIKNLEFNDSLSEGEKEDKTKPPLKTAEKPTIAKAIKESKVKENIPIKEKETSKNKKKEPKSTMKDSPIPDASKDLFDATEKKDIQQTATAKKAPNKSNKRTELKIKRKDLSDTELDVTVRHPKPLKSYSSDTELEVSKRQNAKPKKTTKAKLETKKQKGIEDDSNLKSKNGSHLKKDESTASQNVTKSRKGR